MYYNYVIQNLFSILDNKAWMLAQLSILFLRIYNELFLYDYKNSKKEKVPI